MQTLFILNDPPYGTERSYNGLRLAKTLSKQPDQQIKVFLRGDAVICAKGGQKVPEGYYNAGDMVKMVVAAGEVGLCGTCLSARGIEDAELVPGATRKTMNDLAAWTAAADKVLVF
jgi:uncharacterized protein involved in oxidation of intracellular sulfur